MPASGNGAGGMAPPPDRTPSLRRRHTRSGSKDKAAYAELLIDKVHKGDQRQTTPAVVARRPREHRPARYRAHACAPPLAHPCSRTATAPSASASRAASC